MARNFPSAFDTELQSNNNFPVELLKIEIPGPTDVPAVAERQTIAYAGTRSNVITVGTNEMARITIPAEFNTNISTNALFNTKYTVAIPHANFVAPTGASGIAIRYGTTAAPWFTPLINPTTINSIATLRTAWENPDNAPSHTSNYRSDSDNLYFDYETGTSSSRTFSLNGSRTRVVLTWTADFLDTNGSESYRSASFSYDPDTSTTDPIYTGSVPTTYLSNGRNADSILTVIGNAVAALHDDITFNTSSLAAGSTISYTGDFDDTNTSPNRISIDNIQIGGVASSASDLLSILPNTGTITFSNGDSYSYNGLQVTSDSLEFLTGSVVPTTPTITSTATGTIATRQIDIDLGTDKNIPQMFSTNDVRGWSLLQTNGTSTGVATTYTLTDNNSNQVTQFTSSVTTAAGTDIATVRSSILNIINNVTETPVNYLSSDNGTNTITVTAQTAGAIDGLWSISINNHGQTTNAGNIRFGGSTLTDGTDIDFTEATPGSDAINNDLRLNTGYTTLSFNSENYTPGSGVLNFSTIEETLDTKTNAIRVSLNGIPNTTLDIIKRLEATGIRSIGSKVSIYQGFLDTTTGQLVTNTAYIKWQGIIHSFSTTEENERNGSVTISVECKNILDSILNTKSGRFTSDTSFKQIDSNDRSMEYVPAIINFNPNFGSEE